MENLYLTLILAAVVVGNDSCVGQTVDAASSTPQGEQAIPASTVQSATSVAAEASVAEKPLTADDEATIRANAAKYVEAYNRRDSATMAGMWSPDALYMDPRTGEGVIGREAIKEQFDYILAGQEDAKLAVTIDSIEFVSPNVAMEKGSAIVTYSDYPPEESTYSAVHIKRDGQWLIDRISESEVPVSPPSNYEHLKPLEWLIGSWLDEDANATIQTDCEWTKNKNFITRSFAVVIGDQVDMSGMQIIGWDAASQQIRSWVFDSEGGFGEGIWTPTEDGWSIQSSGTLTDGGTTSATNVLKKINDDSFTWQSINREANGELLPNVEEVMIVRGAAEIGN